ncbi:MAG: DsrH/TusB family sulfur metabolism protein [Dehalococcoidia bacterium]
MANLYLIDKKAGPEALELAQADKGAQVVLIQDGVYLDAKAVNAAGGKVYAVKRDVELRGLGGRLPSFAQQIDYGQLVDLILANKVINFA